MLAGEQTQAQRRQAFTERDSWPVTQTAAFNVRRKPGMRLRLYLNNPSAWQNHPAISQPLTTHELPYGST